MEGTALGQLLGHSVRYRIALRPACGRKVFTLQTLAECNERFVEPVGKVVKAAEGDTITVLVRRNRRNTRLQGNGALECKQLLLVAPRKRV